ncbi:hypothetical protein KHQ88_07150 [Mycoplasmatota bacterium]|nr:hypothetical protein KHQ88_07150 [Mycoplasmatota bacterium]
MSSKQRIFPEVETFKEKIEIKYLVRQNVFVLSLIALLAILSIAYLIFIQSEIRMIMGLSAAFIVILIFNIASLAYGMTNIEFLKFNKFITSISFFTLIIILILFFKSPSFIPLLFLGYLIVAIYKDLKVLGMISLYFVLTMTMLLVNYSYLFDFKNNPSTNYIVIGFFVFFFLTLLMISTYITIKESKFFYNEISFSKEKEMRNLDLLIELKEKIDIESFDQSLFYSKIKALFKEFSHKLKIDNVFEDKIEVIEKLSNDISKDELLKEYPNYTIEDLIRLENLSLTKESILRKIALKIYYFNQKKIHEKEIFSETHFESFNKSTDEIEVKIISFAIFFVILKKGLPGIESMSNDDLYEAIIKTDFYHYIHPEIREIYEENPEVFNAIVADAFSEVAK